MMLILWAGSKGQGNIHEIPNNVWPQCNPPIQDDGDDDGDDNDDDDTSQIFKAFDLLVIVYYLCLGITKEVETLLY